ncbi:MAG: Ig-like domain-containing protein [Kofleriaceae bacterium]
MSRFPGALLCTAVLALVVVAAAHVSSCYSPPTPDCGFSCNGANGFQCPPDYTCAMADQTCKLNTAPAGMRCQSDAAPDLTPKDANLTTPTVNSRMPDEGATNVPRTSTITVTFSRDVMPPDASDFLVMDGPVSLTGTYAYTQASNTTTFTPLLPFHGGHTIMVTLTSDIKSITGSPIMGTSWSFTTLDDEPPELTFSDPLDTQAMVPVTSSIVMTFSEPVVVPNSAVTVAAGATGIAGMITAMPDNKTFTFTPTLPLPAASTITVSLSVAIVDMAVPPNALAPTQFSFTTQ